MSAWRQAVLIVNADARRVPVGGKLPTKVPRKRVGFRSRFGDDGERSAYTSPVSPSYRRRNRSAARTDRD